MTLPTAPQTRQSISVQPQQARVMLVGTPGSGKTTLAATWAPTTTLIIDTQHGTDLLDGEHYVEHIGTWQEFSRVVADLTRTRHHYTTVVIDLVDDLWKFADQAYAGKDSPLASATDDWQRSINTAEGMFRKEVGALLASRMGLWFVSHAKEKEIKKTTHYSSELNAKVLSWVQGAAQFVFLAETLTGDRRRLHTQPSASFGAKSRVPMPEPMDLDARALWLAMDRGLNPHLYTPEAIEARKAAKDGEATAANEPPTPADAEPVPQPPEAATPPPERKDPQPTGKSDVPAEDPWFADVQPLLKGIPSPGLRAAVTAAGGTVPERVASWKATILALDEGQRKAFVGHLQELQAGAPDPMPWDGPEPDDNAGATEALLDAQEARAEAA